MALTPRQKQILDFVNNYSKKHGLSPSLEEIKKRFRLRSVSNIHQHIAALEAKGYLQKQKNQPRGIEISKKEKLVRIPLLGVIAAGHPVENFEHPETIQVQKSQLSLFGEHYALRVQGDSMIDDGIFDGDIVIIRKQSTAKNGETIVALLNDTEVTLKKIYLEKNRIRLQPANPKLKPIFTKNLTVQGKVVSVIRNFEKTENLKSRIQESEFTKKTIEYIEKTDINYRKSLGQYFTPKSIREKLLEKLPKNIKNPKVLDPACGTGEFLITAKEFFKNPELHGWDIDKELVETSKQLIPESNIKKLDSLFNEEYENFDFVIGNPPYFEFNTTEKIKNKFDDIINGRVNIFALFIYQGLRWLKNGGYLAYVVPPSMNNGAYFQNLRKYIVENANIEYMRILKDPKLFNGALQSTMLLILKKGRNKGDYIFKKNGLLIFSENSNYLKRIFKSRVTLNELGYTVKTGRLVWNQNKNLLTNNPKEGVPLIWAHNITPKGLKLPIIKEDKPQYVKIEKFDKGPAIVVNRITGSLNSVKLNAAVIPAGMKFIAENHVNVIYPPNWLKVKLDNIKDTKIDIERVVKQLSSKTKVKAIENITGNTQISKTELEKLFPITT